MNSIPHPMTESDPLYKFRRRSDLIPRQAGMDLCLYDPVTNHLHILNPMAAAIWQHVTPDRSVEAIVHAFALHYGTETLQVYKIRLDVLAGVNDLKMKKLILREDEKNPTPPEGSHKVPEKLTIPEPAISSNVGGGYVSPSIKTFTSSDLEGVFNMKPPLQGVMRTFGDTYSLPHPDNG